MGNPKFVGGSIAHIGIAIMCLGFVTSSHYDSKATLSLKRGKPVETMGYRLTYLGYKELDSERYAFNVQVEHGNTKRVVAPIMRFNTQENSTIRNPDLINFFSRDFYVSPVTVEEASQSTDVPLRLTKGEPQQIKGLGIEFQGFGFADDHRAAMAEGNEFFINAFVIVLAHEPHTTVGTWITAVSTFASPALASGFYFVWAERRPIASSAVISNVMVRAI